MSLAELVLSILIQTNVNSTKLQLNNHNPSVFTPGESLNERNIRINRDLAQREAEQSRKQTNRYRDTSSRESVRGSSYTGNGQAKKLYQDNTNNCAKWVKRQTPYISTRIYYAGSQPIQGKTPQVGAIAMEDDHFSLTVEVKSNSIIVHESNYIKGWITEREIPLNKIRGFIYS